MKQIVITLFLIFLASCGQNSHKTNVTNAHNESYDNLRWSKDTKFPLIIKVPSSLYADANFRQAIENAANTWNQALLSTVGKDVLKIESFDNSIKSQLDLENKVLSLKCVENISKKCSSSCNGDNIENCSEYCSRCYLKKTNYSSESTWRNAQNEKCNDIQECNDEYRPLKITDYINEPNQMISQQNQWFQESSDLTIAITAYSFDTDSKIITNADIIFNDQYYTFSYGNPVLVNEIDFESSLLHELGHFLGMSHVQEKESIMYPSLNKGQIKRNISEKDKERIQNRYQ